MIHKQVPTRKSSLYVGGKDPNDLLEEIAKIRNTSSSYKPIWYDLHNKLIDAASQDPNFANDSETVKEILSYANELNERSCLEIIDSASKKGIGHLHALWIASHALAFERVRNYISSLNVFLDGLNNECHPKPFLENKFNEFKKRMKSRLETLDSLVLGTLNGILYEYKNGFISTSMNGTHVDPEIDVLKEISFNKPPTSPAMNRINEIPGYNPTLLLDKMGNQITFIEARLSDMGINYVENRLAKRSSLKTKTQPLRRDGPLKETLEFDQFEVKNETKKPGKTIGIALPTRKINKDNSKFDPFGSPTEDLKTNKGFDPFGSPTGELNNQMTSKNVVGKNKNQKDDFDFFEGSNQENIVPKSILKKPNMNTSDQIIQKQNKIAFTGENEQSIINLPKRKINRDEDSFFITHSKNHTPAIKRQPSLKAPAIEAPQLKLEESTNSFDFGSGEISLSPFGNEKTTKKVNIDPQPSPRKVMIQRQSPAINNMKKPPPSQRSRCQFVTGETITTDGRELKVLETLGKHSYLVVEGVKKFVLKPLPESVPLFRPRRPYLFCLPDSSFNEFYVTEFIPIPFNKVVDAMQSKFNAEVTGYFLLLGLLRMLEELDECDFNHGSISVDNLVFRVSPNELPGFDDGAVWNECGLSLTRIDKMVSEPGNDRGDVKRLFYFICTKEELGDREPVCPKKFNKALWDDVFTTLSEGKEFEPLIKNIITMLKGNNAMKLRSAIARLICVVEGM